MYLSFNPNSNLQNIFTGMHSFEIPLEFPQSKQALYGWAERRLEGILQPVSQMYY